MGRKIIGATVGTTLNPKKIEEILGLTPNKDGNVTLADGRVIYFGTTLPEDAPAGSILIDLSKQESNGGIAEETDPTVPAWAKKPQPPKLSQLVNDAGFVTAQDLPSGGDSDKWELIVEQTEPLTNTYGCTIETDSNGEPLKLKEAILFIDITTKGNYGYLGTSINGSSIINITNTSNNRTFRIHFKKDELDGAWIGYGGVNASTGTDPYSTTGMPMWMGKYRLNFDNFINKIIFSHGGNTEYARYKLYGVRG